uniref:Uncharacterized protein n=1 Tax=Triticum urartu TaxID=4572 RepID=A0A8R7TRR1_TRIUA
MVQEVVATAEVMGITTLVVVMVVLEEQEEDIIVMVVAAVVLMTTVVGAVVVMEEAKRTTKVTVAMDRLPLKALHPMALLQVTTHRPQVPMEATMCTVQTLQCHPLTAMVAVEALTHQAMVPHLRTHIVAVPQGGKEACHLHMMVVGLRLGVEAQVVLHLLIMAEAEAAVVILQMLPLNLLQRLSSVMQTVVIPATMQGFTSQTCLQM